jgi:hypothetical protein
MAANPPDHAGTTRQSVVRQVPTWEVSLVHDTAARFVIATGVEGDALERAVAKAQQAIRETSTPHPDWKTPAILIQRTDQTPEAKRERWERDFYDVDRASRRRRRYRASLIEREWIEMVKRDAKEAREAAKLSNNQYKQRR